MPTQKNSVSWNLQLGFNLAFKRLTARLEMSAQPRSDSVLTLLIVLGLLTLWYFILQPSCTWNVHGTYRKP